MPTANVTFKQLLARINRNNRRFEKASQPERIVMVSRDVLDLLKLDRIGAVHGSYVNMPAILDKDQLKENNGTCQVSDVLKMPNLGTCTVCAIGAGMVAATLRLNKVSAHVSRAQHGISAGWYADPPAPTNISGGMSERAKEVFGTTLLMEMEEAFEHGSYGYSKVPSEYYNGAKRLRAIYQNLLNNRGEKFTWYRTKTQIVWHHADTND